MTNNPHEREPRSRTLLRHTRQAIKDGRLKVLPFSEAVSARYLADVQPEDRAINLREDGETADSALKAKKANHQIIDRFLDGTVKTFPADLEDAWVASLPQPYRQRCERELSARRGFVPVVEPKACDAPAQQAGELSDLLREVGETTARLAPIFADGTVDSNDLPHIVPALEELGDLLMSTLQLQRRLTKVIADAAPSGTNVRELRKKA
jgi:hypothetical protein